MTTKTILHRRTNAVLYSGEHDTVGAAAVAAFAAGTSLGGADLGGADLAEAYLVEAYLVDANLAEASLVGANLAEANLAETSLVGASLVGANLFGASLFGTDLRETDLRGANLFGANLHGATINWSSHDLVAELLRQAAGDDLEKRMVAGLVLVSRDWDMDQLLMLSHPLEAWVIDALSPWVEAYNGAPHYLLAQRNRFLRQV